MAAAGELETTHQRSDAAPAPGALRGGPGWLIQVLCLAFAVFVLSADVGYTLWDAGLEPRAGALGASFEGSARNGGFVRVANIKPGGALAREGVVAGDRVAFDRPYDAFRYLQAGEPVAFTLVHAGRTSRRRIAVPPREPVEARDTFYGVIMDVANPVCALFGAFIIWRSRRQATILLLGMVLVAFGLTWSIPPFWLSAPAGYPFALAITKFISYWAVPVLFYAFALRFHKDCGGVTKTWGWALFWLYGAAQLAITGLIAVDLAQGLAFQVVGGDKIAVGLGSDLGLAACLAYLFLGWRRSSAGVRQRYALMLVGAASLVLAQIAGNFVSPGASDPAEALASLANSILAGVIGPCLLAYAILRHRVFDLGFAVNRTLVYGLVSAILLAAFGLIEWAVDHLVPIRGREQNALIDAAIAVGVFLAFHRVRDFVEHVIEGLFFRRWQKAEAQLRRFVKEAAFATRAETLTRGFASALGDYADGADAAIYLIDKDGGYRRTGGDLAGVDEALDPDDPALMAIRAEPKALAPGEAGSAMKAALAAPMVNRNEVTGVALLGLKPSSLEYRPDEIELIGWATRQVGLELHALKVEQLSTEKIDLDITVGLLRKEIEILRSVIPQQV